MVSKKKTRKRKTWADIYVSRDGEGGDEPDILFMNSVKSAPDEKGTMTTWPGATVAYMAIPDVKPGKCRRIRLPVVVSGDGRKTMDVYVSKDNIGAGHTSQWLSLVKPDMVDGAWIASQMMLVPELKPGKCKRIRMEAV